MTRRSGFTLYEVLISLMVTVLAAASFTLLTRITARGISRARRWTLMAAQAETLFARLRTEYQRQAPSCFLPDSGSSSAMEGIRLYWAVRPDSTAAEIQMVISDSTVFPQVIDTMWTRVRCE